jgi:glutathione reductase (NADPH)
MLDKSGVKLIAGRATLAGPGEVDVGGHRLRAKRILLALGAAPATGAIPGLAAAMTSNELLDLRELPRSLLVVGGGYIGIEFASILRGFGVEVTLACRDRLPLRGFDEDLRTRLVAALEQRGIRFATGVGWTALEQGAGGFRLHRTDGSTIEAAAALNATGRLPNTAGIGLDRVGVRVDELGAIAVDIDNRSSASGIWAIGDVTNRRNLTPVAIAEGRAFADTEFGHRPARVDHRTVATAVFTDPPLGTVGLTEEQAVSAGPVDIYESEFRPMKSAFAGGAMRTYMKLIVDGANERVLGAHMVGSDAPEIIQAIAVAITCAATKRDFDRTIAVHPTAAEELVLMRDPVRRRSH